MSKPKSGLFRGTKGYNKERASITSARITKPPREPDFYTGANGKTMLAKCKKWIGVSRRDRLLAKAKNADVKEVVGYLYRQGSYIGDGGTASALKFEKTTGLGLGRRGNTHEIKARNEIVHIGRMLKRNDLSQGDRKLLRQMRNGLIKALGGK